MPLWRLRSSCSGLMIAAERISFDRLHGNVAAQALSVGECGTALNSVLQTSARYFGCVCIVCT